MSRSGSGRQAKRRTNPLSNTSRRFFNQLAALCLGPLLGLGPVGCDEPPLELRSAVELLAAEQGEVAERAWLRVSHHGRTALPYLEAALHRVAPPGRRNVIIALRRLALPESAPTIGHVAAFDSDAQVRAEAYRTLELWASTASSRDQTSAGPAARSALRKVDEIRSDL